MEKGLGPAEVNRLQSQYGPNSFDDGTNRSHAFTALLARFKNPLVIILMVAATLSLFFGDKASFFIIITIVSLSVSLDFINTYRSERAAEALKDRVRVKVQVRRGGEVSNLPVDDLVPGDIVLLQAGRVVPADGIIIEGQDIYCNESSLTGESFPQSKPLKAEVYMSSDVVSGAGAMKISATGKNTKFAHIVASLEVKQELTAFDKEIRDFSLLIIRITFVLVIFVFGVNALLKHDLLESLLFSLALAVGLTPELLPLIITLNLTKGSLSMARNGVIVKQLAAVQNFGSMDILCTDKTGTLTEDRIVLVKYVDGIGESSQKVLEYGYLVSVFSTGFQNPLDDATKQFAGVSKHGYKKIDEIPFDFERRREAVIVHKKDSSQRLLIVKGAPEALFKKSSHYQNTKTILDKILLKKVQQTYDRLSQNGFRVLAVATKPIAPEKNYEPSDETDLCLQGFLAFLDPAKQSVGDTLELMRKLGIDIRIITGDNALVTAKIADDIGLGIVGIKTGEDIAGLNDKQLAEVVERTTVFARVDPEQKLKIIQALQKNGHVVGYMGDGINDAPSIRAADVGISVNNAVDVAKAAADFILLNKSLRELVNGVIDGRKTFANTLKYLRMSLSSNFGNMISMAAASLFLPFLPLLATQILLNNLLYDTSQFAIPLDNVDEAEVFRPRQLSMGELKRFMWSYGILSSIFDFLTFGLLLMVFHADEKLFQAGWFIESFLTQVLVVYIIRSQAHIAKRSSPSIVLILSTLTTGLVALMVVLLPLRTLFHFGSLNHTQIIALGLVVIVYLAAAEAVKQRFYAAQTQN
ncbi:MAG: magnesium-translocating P-type ATPase [Candidatus Saccharimonadales bacterium]